MNHLINKYSYIMNNCIIQNFHNSGLMMLCLNQTFFSLNFLIMFEYFVNFKYYKLFDKYSYIINYYIIHSVQEDPSDPFAV